VSNANHKGQALKPVVDDLDERVVPATFNPFVSSVSPFVMGSNGVFGAVATPGRFTNFSTMAPTFLFGNRPFTAFAASPTSGAQFVLGPTGNHSQTGLLINRGTPAIGTTIMTAHGPVIQTALGPVLLGSPSTGGAQFVLGPTGNHSQTGLVIHR